MLCTNCMYNVIVVLFMYSRNVADTQLYKCILKNDFIFLVLIVCTDSFVQVLLTVFMFILKTDRNLLEGHIFTGTFNKYNYI